MSLSRSIPGPVIAKTTRWWLRWFERIGQREVLIDRLHREYGPVVRISPSQVSVNTAEGVRNVYDISRKLDRPAVMILFHNFNSENMFSTLDAELHLERRKVVRSLYSAKNVESAINGVITDKVAVLNEHLQNEMLQEEIVDVYPLFRWLGVDIMSQVVYGERLALDLMRNPEQREMMRHDLEKIDDPAPPWFAFWFPGLVQFLRRWNIAPESIDGSTPDYMGMKELSHSALKESFDSNGTMLAVESDTILQRLLFQFEKDGPTATIPDHNYILSECFDHFSAGISTTGNALSAIVYELSLPKNAHRQARLREELLTARKEGTDLKNVRYLEDIIRETLRVHPPSPISLDRKITARSGDIEVHGYKCPAGTEIGAQAHSLHQDPEVFPEPESWVPERWGMETEAEQMKSMKRQLFAFGAGQRMCVGMNLAWSVMRHTVDTIYGSYRTKLTAEWLNDDGEVLEDVEDEWLDGERQTIHLSRI